MLFVRFSRWGPVVELAGEPLCWFLVVLAAQSVMASMEQKDALEAGFAVADPFLPFRSFIPHPGIVGVAFPLSRLPSMMSVPVEALKIA